MDKEFTVEHSGDHIRVELSPDFEVIPEHQEEFWNRLRAACDEHETRRVLVAGFVPAGERTATEVMEAGQRTAAIPNLWLAFCLEDFIATETSELFEVVAASKGVRVKFFSETAHALTWLRNNAPR